MAKFLAVCTMLLGLIVGIALLALIVVAACYFGEWVFTTFGVGGLVMVCVIIFGALNA